MSFKSQAGEDKFLYEHFFSNKRNGVYIELGAMGGLEYSNTYFFEKELGWSGVLIEPNRFNYKKLQVNRPSNYLFNELVSNNTEPVVYRYFEDAISGVSGVESTMPRTHFEIFFDSEKWCSASTHTSANKECMCWWKVLQPQGRESITPVSLTEIMKRTPITEVDFLSLDVEGHEYEVLESWDFSIPINVILIEMLGVDKIRDELCRKKLKDNNYRFYSKCAHNEVYTLIK